MAVIDRARGMSEWRISVICAVLAAVGPVSFAIYTPAMPAIASHFGTPISHVQLSISLYFAGFAIAQLFCGPLADGVGRKPVIQGFMGLYVLACVLAVLAPNIWVLIVARVLQGVGAAVGVALSRTIVRDVFPAERGVSVQAVIGIMLAIGPTIAPFLGGVVTNFADWRAVFGLLALFGGATMLVVALGLVETGQYDPSRIRPAAIAGSYRDILANRAFLYASLVLAGTNGTIYAQGAVLAFVMIDQVGYSPGEFGLAMLMQPGVFLAGSLVVRVLLGRLGHRTVVAIGIACVLVAAASISLLVGTFGPSFWTVMLPVGIYNWGVAFTMPTMTVAALAPFEKNSGAAAAMLGFVQMGAGLCGGLVAAIFVDPAFALLVITPAMTGMAVVSWWLWARLPPAMTR